MVTTRITDAVPITMPSAVRAKRVLLARKLSAASLRISLIRRVRRALNSVSSKPRWRVCSVIGFIVSLITRCEGVPQSFRSKRANQRQDRFVAPLLLIAYAHRHTQETLRQWEQLQESAVPAFRSGFKVWVF